MMKFSGSNLREQAFLSSYTIVVTVNVDVKFAKQKITHNVL